MARTTGSPAKLRALARLLREHRERAGIRQTDLQRTTKLSPATLSRIENHKQLPTEREVVAILDAVGVWGDEREMIIDLAVEANRPNWSAVGDLSEQLATMMDYEQEATEITCVSVHYFPGLLQTREYARAVFVGSGAKPDDIPRLITTRMRRQQVLTRDRPATLHALVDESALRRPVGGPAVMAAQLRHVLQMAERRHITVQIVPYTIGAHLGLDGSYILFEFTDLPPVAHSESSFGGDFLDEEADLETVIARTATLRQSALSPADSAGLMGEAMRDMEGM